MMKLTYLKITGFRSLADVTIPLQDMTILIGRNNAGKSNTLSAIKLLLEGTARDLSVDDFHGQGNEQADQIVVEALFEGVDAYLPLCEDRHRTKVAKCLENGALRVRRIATRSPLELGKLELWQPLEGKFGLPTGIEGALKQFLPEVIFIEAFKDPTAEAQAKSTTAMGKLLKQIVERVVEQVGGEVQRALDQAARKFNVMEKEGQLLDERPEELKRIEGRIRQHIQAIFEASDVRLRFNFPDVGNLMTTTATIELKDRGPWTSPELKGQGFQRTLYLALLQALAEELRLPQEEEKREQQVHRPFILLFEEPEDFLHPALQREMGDVLESISQTNQTVIATHSPLLVTPQRIGNVRILRQGAPSSVDSSTCCLVPDLESLPDVEDKQLAFLLRFSSSSEFLFADCALVVEGPSDRALLEASWSVLRKSLCKGREPTVLAIVEAGDKAVVPVWVNCLKGMGFVVHGVVDLDFLWNGAGKCLGAHPDLSQFADSFWQLADAKGLSEVKGGNRSIPPGRKEEAFRLISENLSKKAEALRDRLRDSHEIWVLSKGEIETYFGLSASSKGQSAHVAQRIRKGEIEIPPEIRDMICWAISF